MVYSKVVQLNFLAEEFQKLKIKKIYVKYFRTKQFVFYNKLAHRTLNFLCFMSINKMYYKLYGFIIHLAYQYVIIKRLPLCRQP